MSEKQAKYEPTEREKYIVMHLEYILNDIRARARGPQDAWAVQFLSDLKWKVTTGDSLSP